MPNTKKKRKNGQGNWGKRTINGNNYVVLTKTYPSCRKSFYGKTKQEALNKADEYEIKNRIISNSDAQYMSLYSYANNWLKNWRTKKIAETTFDYYTNLLETHLKNSKLGIMQLKFLNKDEKRTETYVTDFLKSFGENHSKSSADGLHSLLNQVSKFAFSNRDMSFDFMLNVEKLTEDEVGHKKKAKNALYLDEVKLLWKEMTRKNTFQYRINGQPGTYVYGIGSYVVLFCCFTGLRVGEVSCLRWRDIDFDNKFFRIENQFVKVKNKEPNATVKYVVKETDPKSEKSERIVPLCNQALEILNLVQQRYKKRVKPDNLVFSTLDTPISGRNVNRLLKSMCTRAGITQVTMHELRHSFATLLLLEDNQNLQTVSALLGHSSSRVTEQVYIHIFEEKKVKAMNLFNDLNMSLENTNNNEKKDYL